MAKSQLRKQELINYIGSSGRSSGPHLHLRAEVQRPGQDGWTQIDPGSIKSELQRFRIGDQPLTIQDGKGNFTYNPAFELTGHYLENRGTHRHDGIDFAGAGIDGKPLTVEGSNVVGFGPGIDDPGGYGNNAFVTTIGTDGSKYRFLKGHLKSAPNTWTNPNFGQATTNPQVSSTTQQPQVDGTNIHLQIDIGGQKEKAQAYAKDYAANLQAKILASLMTPPSLESDKPINYYG